VTKSTESNPVCDENSADKKKDDENVEDFLNEIKNTAIMKSYEQAGFIYEPTSGLYWVNNQYFQSSPNSTITFEGF
jgi:hypothetical protein